MLRTRLSSAIFIFLFLGKIALVSGQERFISKPSLAFMSENRVYSIQEDSTGALWFYTIDGIIRYNGHSYTSYDSPLLNGHFAFNGSDRLYVKSPKGLTYINPARPDSLITISLSDISLSSKTAMLSEADSLFISKADSIYVTSSDGDCHPYARTPDSARVRVLHRAPSGELVVGTSLGVAIMNGGETVRYIPTPSGVSGLYAEPGSNTLLVGLAKGGFFSYDIQSGEINARYNGCKGKEMQHTRSFCRAGNGCTYIGTSNGLFRLSKNNCLEEIALNGKLSTPVYEVYADSDGNLWVCTVYSGVVYSNLTSHPFTSMPPPESTTVKGLAQDAAGTVWASTDGHGLFHHTAQGWSKIEGTDDIKYQRLFNVEGIEGIVASDWYGTLFNYYKSQSGTKTAILSHIKLDNLDNQITAIYRSGTDYLLGTKHGLFAFNPANESEITRKINCKIGYFIKIVAAPDGNMWMAGAGLACCRNGQFKYVLQSGIPMVYDIDFDENGTLWGCMGASIFRVDNDEILPVKDFGTQTLFKLILLPGHKIFCLAEHRIIIYDIDSGRSISYGDEMGLTMGSTRFSPLAITSDGNIWIAGTSGFEIFDPSRVCFPQRPGKITFDKITTTSRTIWLSDDDIVLGHGENDIEFDFSDYSYTGVQSSDIEYKLSGYDSEWKKLETLSPISYSNLRPGNYSMKVRSGLCAEDELSCHVRIRPVWYASVPAVTMEILLLLCMLLYFVRNRYAKAILKEKLRLKEEQYEKQTSFFINLSFKMRTPVNLMIGQLEKYFKDYGMRARGAEDIQEIYKRTSDLREMISEYVDTQNETFEREPRNARLVNAALGAIERNIFSQELNVTLLCNELNMGKTKLTALMKEATGMSPGEYIEDTRLRYAAEMLRNDNYSVSEISDRLGFASASYFSVRFKKKYGISPSTWANVPIDNGSDIKLNP